MISHEALSNTKAMNESDKNDDTCIASPNFTVLQSTMLSVDDIGFDESFGKAENIPMVAAATVFNCPSTKETYILVC